MNSKIIIEIDGYKYEYVNEDLTILEACLNVGVHIPRFCYHEKLKIAGNCRMCLVEIIYPSVLKPIVSCSYKIMNDMIISTQSMFIKKAREGILEFLLVNHPLDCPICDQGSECDLQDEVMVYGSDRGRYYNLRRSVSNKFTDIFIKTIMTRCIHCTRCIRFLREFQFNFNLLGLVSRGNDMKISNFLDMLSQSILTELSGNVIDLCPVGALTSKPYNFKGKPSDLISVASIDFLDSLNVNIVLDVDIKSLQIMRILPFAVRGIELEWITNKIRFCYDILLFQRLQTPLLRLKNIDKYTPTFIPKFLARLIKSEIREDNEKAFFYFNEFFFATEYVDSFFYISLINNFREFKKFGFFQTFFFLKAFEVYYDDLFFQILIKFVKKRTKTNKCFFFKDNERCLSFYYFVGGTIKKSFFYLKIFSFYRLSILFFEHYKNFFENYIPIVNDLWCEFFNDKLRLLLIKSILEYFCLESQCLKNFKLLKSFYLRFLLKKNSLTFFSPSNLHIELDWKYTIKYLKFFIPGKQLESFTKDGLKVFNFFLLLGSSTSLEYLLYARDFVFRLGFSSSNLFLYNMNHLSISDLISFNSFNLQLEQCFSYNLFINLFLNLRLELPLLNSYICKNILSKKNMSLITFGLQNDLVGFNDGTITKFKMVSSSSRDLCLFLNGHKLAGLEFFAFEKCLFLIGVDNLAYYDIKFNSSLLLSTFIMILRQKFNFFLSNSSVQSISRLTSFVNSIEIGVTSLQNSNLLSFLQFKTSIILDYNVFFFLNFDDYNYYVYLKNFKLNNNSFFIYQGFNHTLISDLANLLLPAFSNFEQTALFINLEGYIKSTRSIFCIESNIRLDFNILFMFFFKSCSSYDDVISEEKKNEKCSSLEEDFVIKFPYTSLLNLRARLISLLPRIEFFFIENGKNFLNENFAFNEYSFYFNIIQRKDVYFSSYFFINFYVNFYISDVMSFNSKNLGLASFKYYNEFSNFKS